MALDFEVGGVSSTSSVAILGFEVAGRERTARRNPFSVGRGFEPQATFWIGDKFVWTSGPMRENSRDLKAALEPVERQLDAWLDDAIQDETLVLMATLTLQLPPELAKSVLATTTARERW